MTASTRSPLPDDEPRKTRRRRPDIVGDPPPPLHSQPPLPAPVASPDAPRPQGVHLPAAGYAREPDPPPGLPSFQPVAHDEADSLSSLERALLRQQDRLITTIIDTNAKNTAAFMAKIDQIRWDVKIGGFFAAVVLLVLIFVIAEMRGVDTSRVAGAASSVMQSAGDAAGKLGGTPTPAPPPAPAPPEQTHPATVPPDSRQIPQAPEERGPVPEM